MKRFILSLFGKRPDPLGWQERQKLREEFHASLVARYFGNTEWR